MSITQGAHGGNSADPWKQRVDSGDWQAIAAELDEYGGALLPQLLTPQEAEQVRGLYDDAGRFRAAINMGRHRFGEGEYRYFKAPYPEPVERLKQALYPRLLPIARDWWARLGRPAPWPDTLDEWLRMCHGAGQVKPTAILLRYQAGDWNGYLFTARDRPVRSARGWSAAPVRHGVSVIRSGQRHTLGLVFHDAP
jgi:hypothetical protein